MTLARTSERRGVVALGLALVSWTGLIALGLRLDPHAANDSWLLLAKSTFADGRQYVPGLFIRPGRTRRRGSSCSSSRGRC
jgi:hypothetical protein